VSSLSVTHTASLPAKIIYAAARAVLPRLVRRIVLGSDTKSPPDGLTQVGRRVNTVARPQRWRPFPGIRFACDHAAEVPVEMVWRADCAAPPGAAFGEGAMLYFHGGGFITGGLDSHRHVVATLARRTRLPVVNVDYRQYPDATVGGSVADCHRAYQWLLAQGADPARTVLAGDSAGGFLAFATALSSQRRGLPTPAGVVGLSALLELDGAARSSHENSRRDAFGIPRVLPGIIDHVCPSPAARRQLSPINGRLETMPPALLIAAESEILRCDAERLFSALQHHGRPCSLQIWPAQLHAFPALLPFLPDSRAAYDTITRFVAECLAGAGQTGQEIRRDVS
jgi:acetyl esterase/lipase